MGMMGPKWGGLKPPPQGGIKKLTSGKIGNPIGDFKIGRKTKSKKFNEVFGGIKGLR